MSALAAQIAAELRMRLRAPATLVALVAVLAASLLVLPDPAHRVSSLSWVARDGVREAPLYGSGYLGYASAVVGIIVWGLIGFSRVAGSVRWDRARGVGAILAATPLSGVAYLAGKAAAHAAYLAVVSSLAVLSSLLAWARWGTGPLDVLAWAVPWLLFVAPAVVLTACAAVLADVTPGLRGRAGPVLWFFAFVALWAGIPALSGGGPSAQGRSRVPAVDPGGLGTLEALAERSVPHGQGFSTGITFQEGALRRVPWAGVEVTPALLPQRLGSLLCALLPMALAVALFDRFDPARGAPRRAGRTNRAAEAQPAPALAPPATPSPVIVAPSLSRSVVAEAKLVWDASPAVRWLVLAASAAAVVPGAPGRGALSALFLLLVPLISEAAAREELSGTQGLVHSQPGVPLSVVTWKAAALALVTLAAGLPACARLLVASPSRAGMLGAGLVTWAFLATALGTLSRGGKLFAGAATLLWYAAVNGLPAADFAGTCSAAPGFAPIAWLGASAALLAAAHARERVASRR